MKGRNKRNKKMKIKETFLFIVLAVSAVFFLCGGVKNVILSFELRDNIRIDKEEVARLEGVKAERIKQRDRWYNQDYLEFIARGKYLVSQEGEQIFKFVD